MKAFTTHLLILISVSLFAKNIYVAKNGNDNNVGSEAQPYLTISKAANVAQAGDVVIISEGTYEELLSPTNSGTQNNPITFKGKAGDKVVITAMQAVNNWTLDQGEIYKATVNWDLGQDNMALHNDQLMDLARWPNNTPQNLFERDYLPACNKGAAGGNENTLNYDGSQGNGHGNTIPHAGKWENGGSLHFYGGAGFLAWTEYVTNSTANKINFNLQRGQNWIKLRHHPGYTGHGIKKGEFFLQGIKEALDYKNEWFFNKNTNTLYVQIEGGGKPANNTLRFRRRTQTIKITKNFIHVENLAVFGGEIEITGTDNRLYMVSSFYGSHTLNVINGFDSGRQSVLLRGKRNAVDQCEIGWGGGNGVYDKGEDNKLLNSYVHDFNYLGNYDCVLNTRGAKKGSYRNNTLTRAGKDVIQAYVDGGEYAYNDISQSMQIADDGGLLYTTNVRAQKSSIHHNTFHDSKARDGRFKAAGIYLDNDSKNWDVHHNVVWNTQWTNIQINWNGTNLNISNNTFAKGSATMGAWHKAGTVFSNVKVWNNLTDKEAVDQEGNQESESTWEPQSDKQNNLVSQASFNNYANNDFTLKPGAQAIDQGREINLNGINYTAGFVGAKPDAGAYEFGVAPFKTGVNWEIASGPSGHGCYNLPGESCSNIVEEDNISFNPIPTSLEQDTSITIDVTYIALGDRDLVVVLNSPENVWLGNGRSPVSAGTGETTVTISLASLPALGTDYKLAAAIRTVGGAWQENFDSEEAIIEIVENVPDSDYVEFVDLAEAIPQSNTIDVKVTYEASAARDISVVMTDPSGNWMANSTMTVQAGMGEVDLTINLANAPAPDNDYKLDATIRTVGGGYGDNTFAQFQLVDIFLVTETKESKSTAEIRPFPNPTTGALSLPLTVNGWDIFDAIGNHIRHIETPFSDISELPSGVYFLNSNEKVYRILKQ